ncbi:MAG: thioredoxin-disulfide reductase [Deltaproteobacteria bacterium]|jgi:thioredoxin reductase (NADPH)|nr:thioredoxin-disulfide reductase [Deltaproteobacteria bacterium]
MEKILILGSGPAGYTAAIYTARANLNPLLLQGKVPGGFLTTTTKIENYPGFERGIQGAELMKQMRGQAERFGTRVEQQSVARVDLSVRPYKVWTGAEQLIETQTLIIATGAIPKMLGHEKEKDFLGLGISTCATCDGAFYQDKAIVVVGGGDSACEEALYLTNFGKTVTLIHRRDELRASSVMQERVLNHPKLKVLWNSIISDLLGDSQQGLTGLKVKNLQTGLEVELICDGLFYAIGHVPNSELFTEYLKVDKQGYLITKPNSSETNLEGVFACGDVKDPIFRQAITAAGSGCMAGIEAERYLAKIS